MPDFRVSDTAAEHPKLRAAGLAAAGLWAAAGSWSMNPAHLTDGWVPAYFVDGWQGGRRCARRLVEVGLWAEYTRNGIQGFQFHDWLDFQRSAEQVQSEKEAALVRRALYSDPDLIAAVRARDGDRCRYCGRKVSWTNRRGSSGATFDHVIPIPHGGLNTLENVVVACRGCNSGKRSRTPEQAGMTLLPPPKSKSDGNQNGTSSPPDREQEGSQLPHPHPVPTGVTSGEGRPEPARGRENPPPPRCPEHVNHDGDPGPCRACGEARRAREAWDADADRRAAEQRSAEARQRAEDRRRVAANCGMCDGEGYIGTQLCHHDSTAAEVAARGSAAVRAAMANRGSAS